MSRLAIPIAVVVLIAGAAPAAAHREVPAGTVEQRVAGRMVTAVAHGDRIARGSDDRLQRRVSRGALARVSGAATQTDLPAEWCGVPTATDDTEHQATAGPAIKVVYARGAGAPDNFATAADEIQADLGVVGQAFLDASGGARTVRLDLGTACAANHLDIQSVELPRTRGTYLAMEFDDRIDALVDDLEDLVDGTPACPVVGGSGCTRDFLVYADGFYDNDGITGVAARRIDDRPGADNASNRGGLFAFVLGPESQTTALHELLHNLGAVQDSSPHSSQAGHCYDVVDVMCYEDGGDHFLTGGLESVCPTAPVTTIDCGHDDYFNPAGAVLDDDGDAAWNIFDSAFLCAPASCLSGNLAPVASFAAPGGARAGVPALFDGRASSDDGDGLAYAWDVDGDGATDGTGAAFVHTYASPGRFTARLTVTDADGAQSTTSRVVDVAAATADAQAPPVTTPPAPAPAPAAPRPVDGGLGVRGGARVDPVATAQAAALTRLRHLGGLRALLRGRALTVRFAAPAAGRLTARLVLGRRTLLRTTRVVVKGRTVALTLRLSPRTRRGLRRTRTGTVRVRLAFTAR